MFSFFRKKRFGEIAIAKGLATKKDIAEALRLQKEYAEKHKIHKEIGAILTEKGIFNADDVKFILEEQKNNERSIMAWFTALLKLNR